MQQFEIWSIPGLEMTRIKLAGSRNHGFIAKTTNVTQFKRPVLIRNIYAPSIDKDFLKNK